MRLLPAELHPKHSIKGERTPAADDDGGFIQVRSEHVAAEVPVRGRDGREALSVAPDDKVSQPHQRRQT